MLLDGRAPFADRADARASASPTCRRSRRSSPRRWARWCARSPRRAGSPARGGRGRSRARLELDVEAIARRPFRALSGGMKQKLLIACALAARRRAARPRRADRQPRRRARASASSRCCAEVPQDDHAGPLLAPARGAAAPRRRRWSRSRRARIVHDGPAHARLDGSAQTVVERLLARAWRCSMRGSSSSRARSDCPTPSRSAVCALRPAVAALIALDAAPARRAGPADRLGPRGLRALPHAHRRAALRRAAPARRRAGAQLRRPGLPAPLRARGAPRAARPRLVPPRRARTAGSRATRPGSSRAPRRRWATASARSIGGRRARFPSSEATRRIARSPDDAEVRDDARDESWSRWRGSTSPRCFARAGSCSAAPSTRCSRRSSSSWGCASRRCSASPAWAACCSRSRHALVLLLPLLALTATGQVVNRARDDGTLELLFSQPIRREAFYFAAVTARRATRCWSCRSRCCCSRWRGWADRVRPGDPVGASLGRAVALSAALLACFVGHRARGLDAACAARPGPRSRCC